MSEYRRRIFSLEEAVPGATSVGPGLFLCNGGGCNERADSRAG